MPAGSDSDRGGDRFERGLYVGLAAAAAAAGMTTAAYLATRQAFKYYRRRATAGDAHENYDHARSGSSSGPPGPANGASGSSSGPRGPVYGASA